MSSIFEAFQSGFEGGQALARQRRADTASRLASERYRAGDYAGAESAFLNEGMIGEAGAIGDLGERSRQRTGREAIRTAMQGEGSFSERLSRGRDAALEQGDFDMAAQFSQMSAEELQNVQATARMQAGVVASVAELPLEQRPAAALRIVQDPRFGSMTGFTAEQVQALPPEFWSDENLRQIATAFMDISEQATMRYNRERDAVEDSRWEREFSEQRRHNRATERDSGVGFASASAFRGRYESEMGDLEDMRRTIETIEPFARDAVANNGRPREADEDTVRTQDGVLLMTVARLAQGPGILSDQDVAMVQGTGIDASVANAIGFINGHQQLSERQRFALSQILLRRTQALESAMWQTHDEAVEFARANNTRPDQLGIRTPRVARPDQGGEREGESTGSSTLDALSRQRGGAQGGLRIGQVVDGKMYMGGDPDDESSWRDAPAEEEARPSRSAVRTRLRSGIY